MDNTSSSKMEIPADIHTALLNEAKNWVLTNYAGGGKGLEAWSYHYTSLTSIQSFSLPGDRAKNLRRLVKLTDQGILVEKYSSRKGQVRSFTLPRGQLDAIGAEAVRHWERIGYVIGVAMDAIQEPAASTSPSKTWTPCYTAAPNSPS
jgi:hypothetical protein